MASHQETGAYFPVDLEGPGVLYKTILSVARTESFGIEVCERERVKSDASLKDDLYMIRRRLPRHADGESWIVALLRAIPILRDILGLGPDETIADTGDEILAAAYYLLYVAYNKHTHQHVRATPAADVASYRTWARQPAADTERRPAVPAGPIAASLAMVLRVKELPAGLRVDNVVTRDEAQEMLEHALHYAAFPVGENRERELGLNLGPTDRATGEDHIYLRLETDDGGEFIGQKTKTKLRDLLRKSRADTLRVREMGHLERVSALRDFSS